MIRTRIVVLALFIASLKTTSQTIKDYTTSVTAFNNSYQFEKKGNFESSIDAIKETSDNTNIVYETNMRLGWLHYKAGLYKTSMSYYEKAISLKPNSIEAKTGYNYPAYALGLYDKVIEQYKKILELDPQNTSVCYNLGYIYYYQDDYKSAFPYFEKVYKLYPYQYDGSLMFAWTNLKLNKITEAQDLFNKLSIHWPNDASILEGLSLAKADLTKDATIKQAVVKSAEQSGKPDYKSAITTLKQVYDKNSFELNMMLAWMCYESKLYTEAVDYYKICIILNPTSLDPRFGIASPLYALGNTNELIEQYQKILEIDPQNSVANYRLGSIFYYKNQYERASKYFDVLVQHYPFSYDELLMHGWNNYQLGKKQEAKELFVKVLMLSYNDKSALDGLELSGK
ncbi:MAG: tetratricopeptide repeat protein [Bacteroidota bacterium]|nr:tetratricopeptide repeat protein [Bacteroidota bacterium]